MDAKPSQSFPLVPECPSNFHVQIKQVKTSLSESSNSQISGGRARLSIPSYYETTISPQAAIIRGFHIRTRGTIVTMAETDLQLSTAICVYSVRSLELTVSRKLPRSSDSRKDIYLSRKSGDQKHYVF